METYKEVLKLICKLKLENEERNRKMQNDISDYQHTVLVHSYNLTLDFIKHLESII